MMIRPKSLVRPTIRLIVSIVLAGLLYVAWDQANHNFGTVQPGRIFRSGQMPAQSLARTIRERHIKTVLNLRGPNPETAWYPPEVTTTLAEGATQIDIPMSSCLWMTRDQIRALVETFDTAEYPMLIHCAWGSERTGLASAFAELLRPGGRLDDARAQFSLAYLFVRFGDGKVMAEHLDQYESWLAANQLTHAPATFRRWAGESFKPGVPSREDWPYDPLPRFVISRPGETPVVTYKSGSPAPAADFRLR